jgi:hypothetical protein
VKKSRFLAQEDDFLNAPVAQEEIDFSNHPFDFILKSSSWKRL